MPEHSEGVPVSEEEFSQEILKESVGHLKDKFEMQFETSRINKYGIRMDKYRGKSSIVDPNSLSVYYQNDQNFLRIGEPLWKIDKPNKDRVEIYRVKGNITEGIIIETRAPYLVQYEYTQFSHYDLNSPKAKSEVEENVLIKNTQGTILKAEGLISDIPQVLK